MIKWIIGTFVSIFILVSTAIIFYWRDIQHDPDTADMLAFFVFLPLAITLLLTSPFIIYSAVQRYKKRQEEQKQQQEQTALAQQQIPEEKVEPVRTVALNLYSGYSQHAFGENEQIVEELKNFTSPELDHQLLNAYGLPILSYRIKDLDDEIELDDDADEYSVDSQRSLRMRRLVQQQLVQHSDVLMQIAEHLKQSALFYDSELAYQYRMHPGWIDPNHQEDDSLEPEPVQPVMRLNRINIHVVLAEDLLHLWNAMDSQQMIMEFIQDFQVIPEQIHIEHHYWGSKNAYQDWFELLEQTAAQTEDVSLIVLVDSEIDQDVIDEKTWLTDHYLPAEFVSSCIVASTAVQINQLEPFKMLQLVLNEKNIAHYLQQHQMTELAQFDQEQPFVLMPDDPTQIKVVKQIEQSFAESQIETHHFLYTKQSIGHTQHLSKVFSFMLGMHLPEGIISMIYSTEHPATHVLFMPVSHETPQG